MMIFLKPHLFFLVPFLALKTKSHFLSSSFHSFSWFHSSILSLASNFLFPYPHISCFYHSPPFSLVSFTSCGVNLHSFLPPLPPHTLPPLCIPLLHPLSIHPSPHSPTLNHFSLPSLFSLMTFLTPSCRYTPPSLHILTPPCRPTLSPLLLIPHSTSTFPPLFILPHLPPSFHTLAPYPLTNLPQGSLTNQTY
jgi:hypothetical protein